MNSPKFSELPSLRIAAAVLPGVITGLALGMNSKLALIISICLTLAGTCLILLRRGFYSFILCCFSIGLLIAGDLGGIAINQPEKITPEFPALLRGTVTNVTSQDSASASCIVEGRFDARILPALDNERVLLRIYKRDSSSADILPGSVISAAVNAHVPKAQEIPPDFPERQYASSLDVQWIARAPAAKVSIVKLPEGFLYEKYKIIENIKDRIGRLFPAGNRGVVLALITGDQTQIPVETRQEYSLSGTAHVLSVSGLHIGVIAGALFLFLSFVRNDYLKFILFTILVAGFVILTGMQAAAIRAAFMAVLILLGRTLQREVNILNIIILSLLFIIITEPSLVFSAGFQMSAASILGIAIFYTPAKEGLSKILPDNESYTKRFAVSPIALSISAGIAVSPVVAYYFGTYSVVSPLSNLFVVPLMSLSMLFAILSLVLSYLSMDIASIYAISADFLISLSQKINSIALSLPVSYLKSGNIFILSLIISLFLIYVIYSGSARQLVFRIVTGMAAGICLVYILGWEKEADLKIIPREQYVAVFCPIKPGRTFVLLADRKPHQYPARDMAMEKYLSEYDDSLVIGINGNAGMAVTDYVRKNRATSIVLVKDNIYKALDRVVDKRTRLSKVIESKF